MVAFSFLNESCQVKNCLFGEDEWSMRDLLERGASDEELLETVAKAVGCSLSPLVQP